VQLDWMALATTAGFTLSVATAFAVLYTFVTTERGTSVRLQRRLAPSLSPDESPDRKEAVAELVAHGLTPLARLARPTSDDELQAVRGRLAHAGFRGRSALQLFLGAKALLPLLLVALVVFVHVARAEGLRMVSAYVLGAAGIGFFLPNVWLDGRVKQRQLAVNRGLPDVLDLLVTCVEAGLGLDAAIQRVAAEIVLSHPVVAEELTLTFLEVKAGVPRTEAFRRLAERTGVQDLRTLAATLNQTDLFGTSIAAALRVQAEGMRVDRMHRAEGRAAVLSAKMTFPLVICFLPSLLSVIVGPALVNIVRALKGVSAP
jgi:tight adherence protein C